MKPVEPGALSIAPESVVQPPEQLRYARWLEWGTRVGLVALILIFLAYGIGLVEPHVPHSRLPEVWNLPVSQFLAATGLPTGWGWLAFAHRGDIANLLGIAMLTGASLLALLALLPLYLRQRERLYAALCVAQVAVLLLAASGLLTAGH
ncbi:hypothetical protein [Piscinibacter sp.]|uniref:hypothetical protein n=1 Tax=Piscinibacter sp. TaxID=1903157 RepID=UPI001B48D27F|nr:hypothetical protein [Piscinibacter sp.]MBP5991940.1 hypothetical protein [Piscinibacter sp.]MBP6029369.1 hypothetical protein [Piscinibacter sp.]